MKNIKYTAVFALLFLFTLSNISCKKFLNGNINSASYNDDSTLFSTVGGAKGALIGTYQNLTGDYAYGIRLSLYYSVDNDEMVGPTSTPYPDNTRRDLAHYGVNSTNSELEQPFANLYQGAEQANLCIYFIQRSQQYLAGNTQMRSMLAEAYTLRAQFYFDLVKIWGDVPFFTLPHIPSTHLPVYPARTDRDSIYDQLLADLKYVEDSSLIGWRTQNSTERISLDVVKGLRARIALYRAGYSLRADGKMHQGSNAAYYYGIVAQECADIMANSSSSLNPSFKSVFTNNANHIFDKEILWAVGAVESGSSNGNTNTKLGYYDGPKLNDVPVYNTTAGTITVTQYGNASLVVVPSYFYRFDSSDTRRDVTICIYNPTTYVVDTVVGTPTTKLTDGKFRRDYLSPAPYVNAQYMGIDWPLMRYSDILLMYAEAQNELGDNTDATTAINLVRARATAPLLAAGLSHDAFFAAIVTERSCEFGGEGMRKYDLIRWNLFSNATPTNGVANQITTAQASMDLFANNKQAMWKGNLITIPSSLFWSRNPDGTIKWNGGNACFYEKNLPQPAGTIKASWATSSAAWTPTAANKATVFPYLAINLTPGKSELYPIPIQEVQMNPNLQYVGNQSLYPGGQNPGY